jgi:TRAP-type mannitol/chloroaromatic compound transport system substrate-binding protein
MANSTNSLSRRKFIGCATGASAAIIASRPSIAKAATKKFRWKISTTWSPKLPVLQDSIERFAKNVKLASNGRLKIKVFAGGELIPPMTTFDAVSQGTIEMGAGASYYWAGKEPAAQFFSAVPFGMNPQQFSSWLNSGGGQKLWEEIYKPFNVTPFALGNSGIQMAGWFKKPVKSVEDLKGLKMRIPGLGGKVMAAAGANVVLLPGSEVYTALERGTIDATEWVGPFHDERLGLYRAAKHYYYPGWHEPGANLELIISTPAWKQLPEDLQEIVRLAARDTASWVLEESEARNGPAIKRLTTQHGVKLEEFPAEVISRLRQLSTEVLKELGDTSPQSKKVYDSYTEFYASIAPWSQISEKAYAAVK